jgi:hypothetical protein
MSKKEYWAGGSWQSQGYTHEPGVPITRSSGESLEEEVDETALSKDENIETIQTNSTHVGHHDGHARTSSASYGFQSHILHVVFSHGTHDYSGISEDQWTSFKSASEAGGVGQWIDSNLR